MPAPTIYDARWPRPATAVHSSEVDLIDAAISPRPPTRFVRSSHGSRNDTLFGARAGHGGYSRPLGARA
jgi:hypothetical protein